MENQKTASDQQETLRVLGDAYYQSKPDHEQVERYAALIITPIVIQGAHYLPHKPVKKE